MFWTWKEINEVVFKHDVMKIKGGGDVKLHFFYATAFDGELWSASFLTLLYSPRKENKLPRHISKEKKKQPFP